MKRSRPLIELFSKRKTTKGSLLEEKLEKGRFKTNEPMSLHTTFRIGGPSDFYFEANSNKELTEAVKTAQKIGLPYFILGGGSNILVSDKGFHGLVIKNKSREIKILGYRGKMKNEKLKIKNVLVEAESGVPFNQLVRFTIGEGLEGLEGFLGLPGTVGGAIACNAHWQDKKIQDFVFAKKTYDKVLLSAVFGFKKGSKKILWERAQQAVQYRQKTQPISLPSAGCIFKNIKKDQALRIGTTNFTASTGFLIEAAGLKGAKIGNVQISPLHANFIVNLGGGKASDVVKLINLVKERIKEKFGVDLEEEIVLVGEF